MSGTQTSETMRPVRVGEEQDGWRLDRFLSMALADLSRSRLQQLIAGGAVTKEGTKVGDANHRVKPGEIFIVAVPAAVPASPQGENIPLDIVYEDNDLVVLD